MYLYNEMESVEEQILIKRRSLRFANGEYKKALENSIRILEQRHKEIDYECKEIEI